MDKKDLLTIGEVADRSGFPQSALRFYEREGLLKATRTSGGQRRYERSVLRRLAFIRAARTIGVGLDALRDGLDSCIGCGCLSLQRCRLYNPDDYVSRDGAGARLLPPMLRRTP